MLSLYMFNSMTNNVSFKSIILFLAVLIVSCSKSEAPSGPAAAVVATYQALEAHDSVGFMQSLSEDKYDVYAMNPEKVTAILNNWKGDHAQVKILNVTQNDSTATVLYNLTVTGSHPRSRDSILARLYLQDGEWKHGY